MLAIPDPLFACFFVIFIVILPWPEVKPAHKVSGAGLPARQTNRVQKKFLFVKSDHLCNLTFLSGGVELVSASFSLFVIGHSSFAYSPLQLSKTYHRALVKPVRGAQEDTPTTLE